jgi:hypothetical protein
VIALGHQPLQARFVQDVVGELFVWKHGEGGALGVGGQFGGFFHERPASWLMTDMTMLIMICNRRSLRRSSSNSWTLAVVGSGLVKSFRSG